MQRPRLPVKQVRQVQKQRPAAQKRPKQRDPAAATWPLNKAATNRPSSVFFIISGKLYFQMAKNQAARFRRPDDNLVYLPLIFANRINKRISGGIIPLIITVANIFLAFRRPAAYGFTFA